MATPILVYWHADPGDPLSLTRIDIQFAAFGSIFALIGSSSLQDLTFDWLHLPTLLMASAGVNWVDNQASSHMYSYIQPTGTPIATICNTFVSENDDTVVANGAFLPGWTLVNDADPVAISGDELDLDLDAVQGLYVTASIYFGPITALTVDYVFGALQLQGSDDLWYTLPRSVRTMRNLLPALFGVINHNTHYEIDILISSVDSPTADNIIKGVRLVAACDAPTLNTETVEITSAYLAAVALYAPATVN